MPASSTTSTMPEIRTIPESETLVPGMTAVRPTPTTPIANNTLSVTRAQFAPPRIRVSTNTRTTRNTTAKTTPPTYKMVTTVGEVKGSTPRRVPLLRCKVCCSVSTGFDMDVATLPTSPTTIAATPSQNAHRTSRGGAGRPGNDLRGAGDGPCPVPGLGGPSGCAPVLT